jgi:hypothetical protein
MKFEIGDIAIVEDAEHGFLRPGDLVRIKASTMHPLRGNVVYLEDPRGYWGTDKEFSSHGLRKVGTQPASKYPTPQEW